MTDKSVSGGASEEARLDEERAIVKLPIEEHGWHELLGRRENYAGGITAEVLICRKINEIIDRLNVCDSLLQAESRSREGFKNAAESLQDRLMEAYAQRDILGEQREALMKRLPTVTEVEALGIRADARTDDEHRDAQSALAKLRGESPDD